MAHWLAGAIPGTKAVVEFGGARLFFPEERAEAFNAELRNHLLARLHCGQRSTPAPDEAYQAASATTLLRPERLARYSAWSARCSNCSAVSDSDSSLAIPMEMVMFKAPGARLIFTGVVSIDWRRPFGNAVGERRVGVGHHHHEFLAAIAAGQVDAAHIGADAGGEFLQHLIADIMAVGVVDLLEEVDVHDDIGQRAAVLLGAAEQGVQVPAHIAAIVQAGELVGGSPFPG